MLRKITLSLLLAVGITCAASADEDTVPDEGRAVADTIEYYEEHLALRQDPAAHAETVIDTLAAFDGRVIIEGFLDGDFCVMLWDAGRGNVVVTRNGEDVPLDTYTDQDGRPAFESGDVFGWLDLLGDELHIEVSGGGQTYRGIGNLPAEPAGIDQAAGIDDSDTGGPMVVIVSEMKCVCKGSLETEHCDGPNDCPTKQPCTLPNGTNSYCVWAPVPETESDRPWCGDSSAGGAVLVAGMGLTTFCGPVRRTVMRRVRRSR
ncbi:MAG: hypothetical protein JXQ75_02355 [Phycisphaerae bacterium]|nr:hypothetical protein [Phycisphaerae bacterium]